MYTTPEVREMKTISYARLQERYSGEYIARNGARVLEHAGTYTRLMKRLAQKHIDRTTLSIGFVPPKSAICIYAF